MVIAPTADADQSRTVHVEHCMGTVFTVDIRDAGEWRDAIAEVVAWLHRVDAVFSAYRPDSDVSRMQRRELQVVDADPEIAAVLALCAQVQAETLGFFTAMPHGKIDPTGLVKGWAIERASQILRGRGALNHAVNGGGDLQLAGEAAPGRAWNVGIADPRDHTRVATIVSGRDFAVATSGTAERGRHILDPFTDRPAAGGFMSASVAGPSLTRADAYATAAFVMGRHALEWVDTIAEYEALLIGTDGARLASSRWNRFASATD